MIITEFLTARLDEEEAAAKVALPELQFTSTGEWVGYSHPPSGTDLPGRDKVMVGCKEDDTEWAVATVGQWDGSAAVAGHIARWDPARVLREVASKRAIVREYTNAVDLWERESEAPDGVGALQAVARHMAAVHADHPDYDQEWAL